MDAAWKHAPTCPLPPSISFQLLETLRVDIIDYLDFVTRDLVRADPMMALEEIQRAADRLTRIVAMTPKALAVAQDDAREHAKLDIKQLRKAAERRMEETAARRPQRRPAKA